MSRRYNTNADQTDRWLHWAAWKGEPHGRRFVQITAEPLCRFCLAQGRYVEATVADHIEPHRGDPDRFWNGPLQSLCEPCHSIHKQRQEVGGYHSLMDESGRLLDPNHPQVRYARRQAELEAERAARAQSKPPKLSANDK